MIIAMLIVVISVLCAMGECECVKLSAKYCILYIVKLGTHTHTNSDDDDDDVDFNSKNGYAKKPETNTIGVIVTIGGHR